MSSEELFKNLFQNATEGDSSAVLVGSLPNWFEGIFLYNGPVGLWDFAKESSKHWFDGLSVMQSIKVEKGQNVIKYRKRYLKSEAYEKAIANGKLIITEYGTPGSSDPDKNLVSRLVSSIVPGEMTDNCACNFYTLGGLTVASTETALLRVVDPVTLETGEKLDFTPLVNVASGRALEDHNGDVYNLCGIFTTAIKYQFVRFPKSDIRVIQKKIKL